MRPEAGLAKAPVTRNLLSDTVIGTLCGVAAALCWAIGFAIAKHGIQAGMTPADLAFHRFAWTGILLAPLLFSRGFSDPGGIGWPRGIVMMLLAGPIQAFLAYLGFTLVPLGHGAVIQPATAAFAGVLLSALILHEHLTAIRVVGVVIIIAGLLLFGVEALGSIGAHGVGGDLLFVVTGTLWACFGVTLRMWSVSGMRATMIVGVLAVIFLLPLHALVFGYRDMIAAGLSQNVLQALVQGGFAGAVPIYLYARAVALLGAGRAALFPTLVPVFAMVLGIILLGEIPTAVRLVGLAIVIVGFRLAMKP